MPFPKGSMLVSGRLATMGRAVRQMETTHTEVAQFPRADKLGLKHSMIAAEIM